MRAKMTDFWAAASRVNGWLTPNEGRFLHRAALAAGPGAHVVEIGSFLGRSTLCLAAGLGEGASITSIDPHIGSPKHTHLLGCSDTYPHFLAALEREGVRERVRAIRKLSSDALGDVEAPIDFLFIDGSHEYEDVVRDYELWSPKVRDGGRIAFHDSWHMQGPHRATAEILASTHQARDPELADTITAFTKVASNTAAERLANRAFLLTRLARGARGFARLTWQGGTRLERVPPLPQVAG